MSKNVGRLLNTLFVLGDRICEFQFVDWLITIVQWNNNILREYCILDGRSVGPKGLSPYSATNWICLRYPRRENRKLRTQCELYSSGSHWVLIGLSWALLARLMGQVRSTQDFRHQHVVIGNAKPKLRGPNTSGFELQWNRGFTVYIHKSFWY